MCILRGSIASVEFLESGEALIDFLVVLILLELLGRRLAQPMSCDPMEPIHHLKHCSVVSVMQLLSKGLHPNQFETDTYLDSKIFANGAETISTEADHFIERQFRAGHINNVVNQILHGSANHHREYNQLALHCT